MWSTWFLMRSSLENHVTRWRHGFWKPHGGSRMRNLPDSHFQHTNDPGKNCPGCVMLSCLLDQFCVPVPGKNQDVSRIIAKIGIPSDKYQKYWKSTLRREKGIIFHKFSVRNSGASSGDVRKLRDTFFPTHRWLPVFLAVCIPARRNDLEMITAVSMNLRLYRSTADSTMPETVLLLPLNKAEELSWHASKPCVHLNRVKAVQFENFRRDETHSFGLPFQIRRKC